MDKERESTYTDTLAVMAMLTSWRFDEVFCEKEDKRKFQDFLDRVRLIEKKTSFCIDFPLVEEGLMRLHYKLPNDPKTGFRKPGVYIRKSGQSFTDELNVESAFDISQTEAYKALGKSFD